jgi:hypothetical protein
VLEEGARPITHKQTARNCLLVGFEAYGDSSKLVVGVKGWQGWCLPWVRCAGGSENQLALVSLLESWACRVSVHRPVRPRGMERGFARVGELLECLLHVVAVDDEDVFHFDSFQWFYRPGCYFPPVKWVFSHVMWVLLHMTFGNVHKKCRTLALLPVF